MNKLESIMIAPKWNINQASSQAQSTITTIKHITSHELYESKP